MQRVDTSLAKLPVNRVPMELVDRFPSLLDCSNKLGFIGYSLIVSCYLTLITRRSMDFFLLNVKLEPRCLAGDTVAVSSALEPPISDLRL